MNVVIALLLVGLGIGIDAVYQHKIRVAECNAYDTGYQQGKKEERIRLDVPIPAYMPTGEACDSEIPSMSAPVMLPETFAERMKHHGRATVWMKKGG